MLPQAHEEDRKSSEAKIKKLIKVKLEIEIVEIERTHRIPKEERYKPSQKG